MKKIIISNEVIDALTRGIVRAVQDRIDNDPDVEDAYLRVSISGNKFTVQCMYLEESNASAPNRDVALLNLMYDTKQSPEHESWIPDEEAIRRLAMDYSELLKFDICQN